MNCEEVRDLLDAYADGELAREELETLRKHLDGCAGCKRLLGEIHALRGAIAKSEKYAPPPALAGDVRARLDEEDEAMALQPRRPAFMGFATHGAAAAAGVLLAILVFWALADKEPRGAQSVLATHVRHLMAEQYQQVASSDRHTVRPWFIGKIDYAPKVVDLTAAGYPLIGGRIDYLRGRAVAALSYKRRKHRISVFVLPVDAASDSAAIRTSLRGFQLAGWRSGDFIYQAVSDLNAAELDEFAGLMRKQISGGGKTAPGAQN